MDNQELQTIKLDIDKLETMIEILAKDIQEIKDALIGNEYGQEGLVKRVVKVESDVKHLHDFKKKVIAWATGVGLGSSTLVNYLSELIK